MKQFEKLSEKLNNRVFALGAALLFFLSMLPIWYLAFYARPSGDDYGYSALTHAAWLDTHSLIEVLKAAGETVKNSYVAWNGDWATTFLFSLMPEVFLPYSFWIVPFIMTGSVIVATWVFMHEICVKRVGVPKADCVIYTSLLLLAAYQFIPSTAIGMYWYVGSVHYMLPHAVGLLGLAWLSDFMRTGRKSRLALLTCSLFFVGGSSYFTSLLLFMILAAVFALEWWKKKNRRKVLLLCIPFLIGLICFLIQCAAPGNSARGGESFGFNSSLAAYTIIESLRRGIITIGTYAVDKTFSFVILFVIALFGVESMWEVADKGKFSFPVPGLFLVFLFGCFSAMFAPEVYSEVYDTIEISLGPATIRYFLFLICGAFSILYCEGWAAVKIKEKMSRKDSDGKQGKFCRQYRFRILFPGLVLAALFLLCNRGWMHTCVDREVVEYVASGQAEDFRDQINSQMKILLDDSIKEAYLVPINPEQGPLMHMPVTTDENAFTNRVVRNFYRKEKVVMIQ